MPSSLVLIVLHAFLIFMSAAKLDHSSALFSRDNSSVTTMDPDIEAKITSPTGKDLTSEFQILLYQPPAQAISNLTGRQIGMARNLNFCQRPRQEFKYSHCNYHHRQGQTRSLQGYIIYCSHRTITPYFQRSRIVEQYGVCAHDEVCMDGIGRLNPNNRNTVAQCVSRSSFKPPKPKKPVEDETLESKLRTDLRAIFATTFLTHADGTTPLSVNNLELDTGVVKGEKEELQSNKTCSGCFTLATSEFQEGTNLLKTQATLGTAGAVAAGIMYLAVLSG